MAELLPTYLLLENDKKSNNLGPTLRCACAYGITTVVAIGYAQCSVQGSHGAANHVPIIAFPTVDQAIASIHSDRSSKVSVVGILGGAPIQDKIQHTSNLHVGEDADARIFRVVPEADSADEGSSLLPTKQSWPVGLRCFEESKIQCFAICKSKYGLSSALARHCNRFVHVPHRSMGGDFARHPLLDLPSSLSIVLHHYSEWAGYDERTLNGHKFELKRVKHNEMEKREERRNQREEENKRQREEMKLEASHAVASSLFDDEGDGDY